MSHPEHGGLCWHWFEREKPGKRKGERRLFTLLLDCGHWTWRRRNKEPNTNQWYQCETCTAYLRGNRPPCLQQAYNVDSSRDRPAPSYAEQWRWSGVKSAQNPLD